MFDWFFRNKAGDKVSIFYQKQSGEIVHGKYYFLREDGPFWIVRNRHGKVLTFEQDERHQFLRGWKVSKRKRKKIDTHFRGFHAKQTLKRDLAELSAEHDYRIVRRDMDEEKQFEKQKSLSFAASNNLKKFDPITVLRLDGDKLLKQEWEFLEEKPTGVQVLDLEGAADYFISSKDPRVHLLSGHGHHDSTCEIVKQFMQLNERLSGQKRLRDFVMQKESRKTEPPKPATPKTPETKKEPEVAKPDVSQEVPPEVQKRREAEWQEFVAQKEAERRSLEPDSPSFFE